MSGWARLALPRGSPTVASVTYLVNTPRPRHCRSLDVAPWLSPTQAPGDAISCRAMAADAKLLGSEMCNPIKRINQKVIWWLK